MFKIFSKLSTKNYKKVSLIHISFNYKHYNENGEKNSCECSIHPCLRNDEGLKEKLQEVIDYVRGNHDMDKIV